MIFQVDKILNCMNTFFFLLNTVNPKLEVHKFPYFRILVNLEILKCKYINFLQFILLNELYIHAS